jgi:hypothetical protein
MRTHATPEDTMATLTPTATVRPAADGLHVEVTWGGAALDRPCTSGWLLALVHAELAVRLATAINAGAVYSNPRIVRDCNGATYVQADSVRMLGRTLNADLRRIGF